MTIIKRIFALPMPEHASSWTPELLHSPHDVRDKSERVRWMFNAIAPRYELINSLFSAGRDATWRRRAVEIARVKPDDDVLDIACGTGDFVRAFARANPRSIVGCDFAHEMLIRALRHHSNTNSRRLKPAAQVRNNSRGLKPAAQVRDDSRGLKPAAQGEITTGTTQWCEADALHLPFGRGSFSITSCAFGVRNFQDLHGGLREMYRVLKPGGRAVILEFTRPSHRIARGLYEFYAHRIMPPAASWISGDKTGAYRYLPRSVVSFPSAEQMCTALQQAGFDRAQATPMTLGIVTVYVATRET